MRGAVARPRDRVRRRRSARRGTSVGAVDFAFLNAGVATGSNDIVTLGDAEYRRAVGANVDGVVFGTRRMAQVMEPGSTIVATASLAGLVAMPLDPIYTLTKHAVVGFVRAVAPQLAERGITINALCPGFADTPIVDADLREWVDGQGIPLIEPAERWPRLRSRRRVRARPGRHGSSSPAASRSSYEFRGVPGPR